MLPCTKHPLQANPPYKYTPPYLLRDRTAYLFPALHPTRPEIQTNLQALRGKKKMGRSPCCCHDAGVKKGPWTEEEDRALVEHIQRHGGQVSSWRNLPKAAGLNRCGKSCRLRWTNYLRPDIKRGNFTADEESLIIRLHAQLGNKYARYQRQPTHVTHVLI